MKLRTIFRVGFCLIAFGLGALGCAHSPINNDGNLQSYPTPVVEASWIREGQPIEYEGHKWYPIGDVEILTDSEVYQIGEYQGVQLFVDKLDTKPYERLYTKFAKNKFRYFEQGHND